MNGTLENIYFENVNKTSDSTNSGIIGYSNQYAQFNNVHAKNVSIVVPVERTADSLYVGGLIGYSYYSKVTNCSITDVNVVSEAEITDVNAGGLIGYSNAASYSNVFAQDVNVVVRKAINTQGVGGLIGREVSSVGTIYNAYSTGYVENNGYRTGGLVGYTEGYIENSYSSTQVISDIDTLGGIVGYSVNRTYISNNQDSNLDIFQSTIHRKIPVSEVCQLLCNRKHPILV